MELGDRAANSPWGCSWEVLPDERLQLGHPIGELIGRSGRRDVRCLVPVTTRRCCRLGKYRPSCKRHYQRHDQRHRNQQGSALYHKRNLLLGCAVQPVAPLAPHDPSSTHLLLQDVVLSLSRAHHILAAVCKGELEPTLEEVGAAHSRRFVLEVDVVVGELLHSSFVVAQLLYGQLFLRYVQLSPFCRSGAVGLDL